MAAFHQATTWPNADHQHISTHLHIICISFAYHFYVTPFAFTVGRRRCRIDFPAAVSFARQINWNFFFIFFFIFFMIHFNFRLINRLFIRKKIQLQKIQIPNENWLFQREGVLICISSMSQRCLTSFKFTRLIDRLITAGCRTQFNHSQFNSMKIIAGWWRHTGGSRDPSRAPSEFPTRQLSMTGGGALTPLSLWI